MKDEQWSDNYERQTANMLACFTEAGEDSPESIVEKLVPWMSTDS